MAQNDLPNWHVLGDQIKRDTTLAQNGTGLRTYWEVPYMIDSGPAAGSVHTVELLPDQFTPVAAEEAIRAHLALVHGTAVLGQRDA